MLAHSANSVEHSLWVLDQRNGLEGETLLDAEQKNAISPNTSRVAEIGVHSAHDCFNL